MSPDVISEKPHPTSEGVSPRDDGSRTRLVRHGVASVHDAAARGASDGATTRLSGRSAQLLQRSTVG
jgi:hypothetical protein